MSFARRFELFESSVWPSFLFPSQLQNAEMELDEQLSFTLDIISPGICCKSSSIDPALFHSHCFDSWAADLASISFTRSSAAVRRSEAEIQLQSLSSRVAALEAGFQRAIGSVGSATEARDRKFKWTADIKGTKGEESHRKYTVVAKETAGGEKSLKWTTDMKGKGSYTFEASTAPAAAGQKMEKDKKDVNKNKKNTESAKLVEIEEEKNPGAIIIRKVFTKRTFGNCKGKRKEFSPQDAALIIQTSFRAYLIRRSQVLRGLRDLAVAKAKLKEIRSLFNSFSYRQRIGRDMEERQRFTEKIIVLQLTVEAIQGSDYMIRGAKKSIIEELEIKLEAVDPQPGRLSSLSRRKFDLPESNSIAREMARGVAQVVELIEEHEGDSRPRAAA